MILGLFYFILLLLLLCRTFGIAENYALFRVKSFNQKFGWRKENDILHVCFLAKDHFRKHIESLHVVLVLPVSCEATPHEAAV